MTKDLEQLPEIFTVWSDEVGERLDPLFYSGDVFEFLKKVKYEVVLLADLVEYIKAGFAAGKQDQGEDEDGPIQIRPTNIDEIGLLKFDKNIYLPNELILEKKGGCLQKGELLFNNTNSQDLVGKTAYFDLDGEYFCSNHITRIKVDEKRILPKYLWQLLNNYQARRLFFNICVNWNNQSGVNIELLKTLKIPLPPLSKQRGIIGTIEKAYAERKKKAEEIKQILDSIDGYVLGELGVKIEKRREEKRREEKRREEKRRE